MQLEYLSRRSSDNLWSIALHPTGASISSTCKKEIPYNLGIYEAFRETILALLPVSTLANGANMCLCLDIYTVVVLYVSK